MVWQLIATVIAVALTAASYYQQKKMKKAAAKQAQDMAAVQISGHDANRALYTVYGETLVGSTIVWKGVSRWRVGMNATGFVNKTLATGSTLTANDQEGAARYLYRLASLCSGPIESVENIIIDGESYSASRFSQDSDYKHFASAISYGPTAGQAFTNLSSYGLALDSTMKGKGVAYSVERLYLHKKYPAYQGEPSTTYVIKGRKVYDPRKDSTSSYYDSSLGVSSHRIDTASTWQWSDNPAICLLDYLRSTEYGRGLSTSVIDLESIVDAADACDVLVSIPSKLTNDSGNTITYYDPFTGAEYTVAVDATYDTYREYQTSTSQKRFRLNIALDGADEVLDNVQKLLNCFKGHLIYANGKYRVTVEDVASSVLSLDNDDIIGGLKISDGDRSQRINRCTVKFLNANKQFKTDQVSWPELTDSQYTTYLNEDQGEKLHRTFTVEGCTDYYQAEDMAEFLVRDSRTALTVTGTFGSRALGLVPGDVISLTYDSAAYSGKYFRITQVGIDPVSMNVNLQMREYDSSVYTWNSSRGNEPLGISWALDDPINSIPDSVTFGTISSSTITKTDGSTSIRVSVPFSANVAQASYLELSWSLENQNQWTTNIIYDADATGTAVFTAENDNSTYDIRMRYFVTNNFGTELPSAYTTTTYTVGQLTGTKLDGIEENATANTIYQQSAEPTGGTYSNQDIWIDVDDYKLYTYVSGTGWVEASSAAAALTAAQNAQSTADGKIETFYQDAEPAANDSSEGDLWIDTNDGNKLYRYNAQGTNPETYAWDLARDGGIAQAISDASDADAKADGKITTFFAASGSPPTADAVGDLWWTTDTNKFYRAAAAGADQITAGEWVLTDVVASSFDNQGDLAIKDNVDLGTSDVTGTLGTGNADSDLINTNISINADGTLNNAGSGAVTAVGLGQIPLSIVTNGAGTITQTGNTLTKDGGTTSAWSTEAYSTEGYLGGAFVSFKAGQTDEYLMVGLNSDPTTSASYSSIDYAWYPKNNGYLDIYESGARVGAADAYGAYTTSTVLSISYDGSRIRYLKDGVVQRTVTVEITDRLFMDSSFYGNNDGVAINSLLFIPLSSTRWADVGGTGRPEDSATVGATFGTNVSTEDGTTVSSNQVITEKIIEHFDYPTSSSAGDLPWTNYSGGAEISIVQSNSVSGGKVLRIGNTSGNDQWWAIADAKIAYDPDRIYRLRIRARQTAGTGNAYLGFAGIAADGSTLVNASGNNSYGSQHYIAASGVDIPTDWTVYEGFVSGTSSPASSSTNSYASPSTAHSNVRYLSPLILVQHSGASGTTEIDSFILEDVGANPNATVGATFGTNFYDTDGSTNLTAAQVKNDQVNLSLSGNTLALTNAGNTSYTLTGSNVGINGIDDIDAIAYANIYAELFNESLLPNYNFALKDVNGKPLGMRGVENVSSLAQIGYDSTNPWIKISESPDSTVAYGFPAIPIDDNFNYEVTIRHKSSAADTNGLYIRFNEYNAPLPSGKTHVGLSSGESIAQSRSSYVDLVQNGAAPGTSFVETTYTYIPTSGTKFASLSFYVWSEAAFDYYVEFAKVRLKPSTSLTNSSVNLSLSGQTLSLSGAGSTSYTLDKSNVGLNLVPNVDATNLANVTAGTLSATYGGTGITNFSENNFKNDQIALSLSGDTLSLTGGNAATAVFSSSTVGLGSVQNVDTTNAANISTGTLPDARIQASGVTQHEGNITIGNVPNALAYTGGGTFYGDLNAKRRNKVRTELWVYGNDNSDWDQSSSTGNFAIYGNVSVQSNDIVLTDGPFGEKVLAWKGTCTTSQEGTGSWCGGFRYGVGTSDGSLDISKTYRFSCWVRRSSTNGNFYIGWASNAVSTLGSGNNPVGNPYSFPNDDIPTANKWYLAVAIIHSSENQTTGTSGLSGWYDPETGKLSGSSAAEFKHATGITTNFVRISQYRTAANIYTEYFSPRWEEVDGNEPSIIELLGTADVTSSNTALNVDGQGALATLNAVTWGGSTISGQPADSAILNTYNKGKTLALKINVGLDLTTTNAGEAVLVNCDNTGTPVANTDGTIIWNGSTISIDRNQSSGYTVLTGVASAKGLICFDTAKGNPFTVNSVACDVAFVRRNGSQWQYDNNGSWANFTPDTDMVALGWLETTSAGDDISQGGLFGEPVPLTLAAFPAATENTGALADLDTVNLASTGSGGVSGTLAAGSGGTGITNFSNSTHKNSEVSINADGTLSGAGAGQVTASGLGYDSFPIGSTGARTYTFKGNSLSVSGGNDTQWNSGAYSINGYQGGVYLSFKPGQTNRWFMLGIGDSPTSDGSYTSVDYQWYCANGGTLSIYEGSSNIGTYGNYTTSTVLSITYDGSRVRYYKDGAIQRTVTVENTNKLYMDSSFYNSTGTIVNNLEFGPLSSTRWGDIAGTGVPDDGADVTGSNTALNITGQAASATTDTTNADNITNPAGANVGSFIDGFVGAPAGSLIPNPDMTMQGPDGRPYGAYPSYGSTTATNISYWDSAKTQLRLFNSGDDSIGVTFSAFPIEAGNQYRFGVRARADVADSNGFYIRIQELDAQLPSGKHAISGSQTGTYTTADTRQITSFRENGSITTSFVDYEYTYTPTSTAKWASIECLNWTGMPATTSLIIDRIWVYSAADVTASNTAANISGQGALATSNTVNLATTGNGGVSGVLPTANTVATKDTIQENGITRIPSPGGASYRNNNNSLTGAIAITLPQSWTNTMMSMTVQAYNYNTGNTNEWRVGGYNYTGTSAWINTFAHSHGRDNYQVRFGHNGTKCVIYIGETNTSWSYIQVSVKDFQAGYSNENISNWDDGWAIGLVTSFGTVSSTISDSRPAAQWAYVGGTGVPDDDADVTGSNTALNISGQGALATSNTVNLASTGNGGVSGTLTAGSGGTGLTSTATLLNSNVSINADGTLSGAGSGQVSASGLGYNGFPIGSTGDKSFTIKGNTLTVSGGTNASWSSGAYSINGYQGGVYLSWTPAQTNSYIMLGIGDSPTSDGSYSSVDYQWYMQADGSLLIYEGSTSVGAFGSYTTSTALSITYDGSRVRYYKDGAIQRTVTVENTNKFYMDSSWYQTYGAVNNLEFGPLSSTRWGDIAGSGVPDDNADVTGSNTALNISGQGSLATQSSVTTAQVPTNCRNASVTTYEVNKSPLVTWSALSDAAQVTGPPAPYDVTIQWRDGDGASLNTTVIRMNYSSSGTSITASAHTTVSNGASASVSLGSSSSTSTSTTVTKNGVTVTLTSTVINGISWSFSK